MMLPPYLLKVRIRNRRHAFSLWLPLFLIGPIVLVFLLVIFLILLPFALLAFLLTWHLGWWRPVIFGIPALFCLFWSLRGVKVDVTGGDERVYIAIY